MEQTLYKRIRQRQAKIAIVGLGYVGMPLALSFAKKADTIGFDVNRERIRQYQTGEDPTGEVGEEALRTTAVRFTADERLLDEAMFFIIAVPTPVNPDNMPDLEPLLSASRTVGRHLSPGAIVVYESTVYPGLTEEVCLPVLEETSGMECGRDFFIGYSPERINPGDQVHRLENIIKVVSGMDEDTLEQVAEVYSMVIDAGVHRASTIRVAEACKVVENTQRDVNIAFINEMAMLFHRMGVDTTAVIDAMQTKWNALGFRPGLVGGHCVGVDPYYLLYRAQALQASSPMVLMSRQINEGMADFIVEACIRQMILAGLRVRGSRVALLGITFKEDCPDTRNSKVKSILARLQDYGVDVIAVDPMADPDTVREEYGISLTPLTDVSGVDCVLCAVAHEAFRALTSECLVQLYDPDTNKVLIDVKGIFNPEAVSPHGISYWRL